MDLCRVCGDTLSGPRPRCKTSLSEEVLEKYNIDFQQDHPSAPNKIHNKCYMAIMRNSFSGAIKSYHEPQQTAGPATGDPENMEVENIGEDDWADCLLCMKHFAPGQRNKLTNATRDQISSIYGIPTETLKRCTLGSQFLCGSCRNIADRYSKESESAPGPGPRPPAPENLTLTVQPKASLTKAIKLRNVKRNKNLLKQFSLTGKNKDVKKNRPELFQLMTTVNEFCEEYDNDPVELGFYILYNYLSRASKFVTARQLKSLYEDGPRPRLSPRRSVANKLYQGRSHRQQRSLALFLKQKMGQDVFSSRQAEEKFVDSIQPRSYSYKLYSTESDPDCVDPLKSVKGLVRPIMPDTFGKPRREVREIKKGHNDAMKYYRKALDPPNFATKYLNNHCETPVPNTLVIIEQYDRLIAAHLHQLGPRILENIKTINMAGKTKIKKGRLRAKVEVRF